VEAPSGLVNEWWRNATPCVSHWLWFIIWLVLVNHADAPAGCLGRRRYQDLCKQVEANVAAYKGMPKHRRQDTAHIEARLKVRAAHTGVLRDAVPRHCWGPLLGAERRCPCQGGKLCGGAGAGCTHPPVRGPCAPKHHPPCCQPRAAHAPQTQRVPCTHAVVRPLLIKPQPNPHFHPYPNPHPNPTLTPAPILTL